MSIGTGSAVFKLSTIHHMQTFEHTTSNFQKTDGYLSFKFGGGFELAIEPSLNSNVMFLALYQENQLLIPKVPIKKGKTDKIYEINLPQTMYEELITIESREEALRTTLKLTPFKKIAKLCIVGLQKCQLKRQEVMTNIRQIDPKLNDYEIIDYDLEEKKIRAFNERNTKLQ